jgi:hypothetical protein
VIEAVLLVTVAVTPAPIKSKYEAVPCKTLSSAMYIAETPPCPAFRAYEAVKANDDERA